MTMGLSEDAARKLWDNYYVPYIKAGLRQRPLPQRRY